MSNRHRVCRTGDLPPETVQILDVNGISVGVYNIKGEFFALRNRCPHRGAPLCKGKVTGLITADHPQEFDLEREGEIVRCPWHGWEFDITTGRSVFNPHRVRARSYPVSTEPDTDSEGVESYETTVENDWVVVHLGRTVARPAEAARRE